MARPSHTTDARVFDLPVYRSSSWIFNCYAIEGDHGQTVLVDPGLPITTRRALDRVHSLGRAGEALHAVATHGHVDHVGGMPLLRREHNALTYLPGRCERYLAGEVPRTFPTRTALRFFPMVGQQKFSITPLRELAAASKAIGFAGASAAFQFPYAPDGYLQEGATLPGAANWHILDVPGHSDDSVCFYNPQTATLISGDAVLTHNGRAWFNPEIVDLAATAITEERLRSLEVRHLLPGHGLPISGHVWKNAISHRERPPAKGLLSRCLRKVSG